MAFDAAIAAAAAAAPQIVTPVPMVPGLVLHVDGDYLAYYASGNDETSQGQSRQNAIGLLDTFRTASGAESIVVHNTAKGCNKGERYLVATVKKYQAQRVDGRKPKNHGYLQDWLMEYTGPHFTAKNWLTREADDGIAACAHHAVGTPTGYAAIATADKDLRMLPGLHVIWKPIDGRRETVRVMPGQWSQVGPDMKQYGLKWFWIQMLMGDAADNIPGLEEYQAFNKKGEVIFKKMGEKTAEAMLDGCNNNREAYDLVTELYCNYYTKACPNTGTALNPGVWADRFCEQAALLWMRCDNKARVTDFAHHAGFSRINESFCEVMWEAVARLENRVRNARAEINSFADSAG